MGVRNPKRARAMARVAMASMSPSMLMRMVSSMTTQSSKTNLASRSTMPIVKARYLHVSLRVKRAVVVTS